MDITEIYLTLFIYPLVVPRPTTGRKNRLQMILVMVKKITESAIMSLCYIALYCNSAL